MFQGNWLHKPHYTENHNARLCQGQRCYGKQDSCTKERGIRNTRHYVEALSHTQILGAHTP